MSEPRPELRIGDRERDLVASVLQEALAEGRINVDELDARLDAALRARTFADLDPLVADLPIEPPSAAMAQPRPGVEAPLAVATGTSPDNRLVLDAGWSSVTRSGRWDIPPFLLLNGAKSTLKVDCLQATPLAEVIDIQVVGSMGIVNIVMPESWAANTDRLVSSWGLAKIKVSAKPDPGAPLLVLHGSVGWGRLTVRYANRYDRRKLAKVGVSLPQRPEPER
jgi:Domain of unknown function (DUF1707)